MTGIVCRYSPVFSNTLLHLCRVRPGPHTQYDGVLGLTGVVPRREEVEAAIFGTQGTNVSVETVARATVEPNQVSIYASL